MWRSWSPGSMGVEEVRYLGRERHEGKDADYEEVDVGDSLELVQEGQRGEGERGVALGAHSVAVEVCLLVVSCHSEVDDQRVLPLFSP